jgi:hypothetical protein
VPAELARRRRRPGRIRVAVPAGILAAAAAVAVGVLVTADGDGSRVVVEPPATEAEPPSTIPSTSVAGPPPTPSSTSTSTSTSTTSTTSTSTTSTTEPPVATAPALPAALETSHGGDAWAVYLAVVDDTPESPAADDPTFARAVAAAESLGYYTGPSSLACDAGGPEALGRSGEAAAAAVYFATEADAHRVRAAFEGAGQPVLGVVAVRTYCLD